jgi:tRNA pseudouridine32 synthase/23S rRNA pseudouridine746 synthase
MSFTLVFADAHLLVLDKPSGLLSVPGRGADKQDCLSRRVAAEFADAQVVHRLDMDTSGLLVMARGLAMQRILHAQFAARAVQKTYVAVLEGRLAAEEGEVDLPLICDWPARPRQKVCHTHGKPSLTRYRRLAYDAARDCSRVELLPHTGRSHQLRVHMQAIGHPILGDDLYGTPAGRAAAPRLLLHATQLGFVHPFDGRWLSFHSPADF